MQNTFFIYSRKTDECINNDRFFSMDLCILHYYFFIYFNGYFSLETNFFAGGLESGFGLRFTFLDVEIAKCFYGKQKGVKC